MASLAEIQIGVMTASMPSFARMLQPHRPYWKQLRTRFPLHRVFSSTRISQHPASALDKNPKAERPRSGRVKNWFDSMRTFNGSQGITAAGGGLKSLPHINTDDLSSLKSHVRSGHRDIVYPDSVLLTRDIGSISTPIATIYLEISHDDL